MYIVRWNFTYKWDKESSVVVDSLKKIAQEQGYKGRVYTSVFGDSQIVTSELEFEDVASAAQARDVWRTGEIESYFDGSDWNDVVTRMTAEMVYAEAY